MASSLAAVYYQEEQYDDEQQEQLEKQQQQDDSDRSTASSSPAPSNNDDSSSTDGSLQSASTSSSPSSSCDSEDEDEQILMLDPSEHFRPETHNGKSLEEFRKYSEEEDDYIQQRVKRTYYQMHTHQTVDFVRSRLAKWTRFDHDQLTIMEALVKLNVLVDESDPDSDLPNIVHAFQTAERIRATHPDQDWFHLTGLIHDLGKVLALWGEQQWAVVGDTFVAGCAYADSIVYRESSFDNNPDLKDSRYNTKYGIYEPNCGLDNVLFSWGHDEYLACVLENHPECKLPKEAIRIIRLHSFYPWHTGGDYMHLCNEDDLKALPLIREFNKFDLYTKSEAIPNIEELIPYYQGLIDKYLPGKLNW